MNFINFIRMKLIVILLLIIDNVFGGKCPPEKAISPSTSDQVI